MPRAIRQQVTFKASPHAVYEALMDSRQHAKFTGDRARISRKVGGKFSAYGDYISGVNLELVPDQKIVQSWRASEWPEGHESQVTFALAPVKGGTRLTFTHRGVPPEHTDDIKQGWIDNYWTPMKALLEK
ncbi:MAG: SRPBCC domain-containing protein [Chloroflexi bacterium]|nr:SRPBCC domain-containing protein [Chloroflexota bacterium]MBI3734856.1 SRPBCC domain-containing protein [Chloroflexota bacterium]